MNTKNKMVGFLSNLFPRSFRAKLHKSHQKIYLATHGITKRLKARQVGLEHSSILHIDKREGINNKKS